jgi:hypothetical protein
MLYRAGVLVRAAQQQEEAKYYFFSILGFSN